jgi:phospholipid/cholesterol/gamma-HCH transport system substrate-binding protein
MKEERRERRLKLRVGVFVVVALVAFLGMIYALGARARLFEPRYKIQAEFTEVGGLAEGATVRLAGVQIGRVSGVELPSQPGSKVRVELTIARRFADRIRKDSTARIETQGLLGDRIVEISVGTAATPPLAPGETIASKDPTDLGQVISQGAETVKNVAALTQSLRETAETLNQSKVISEVAAATVSARKATDQLAKIVDQVEKGRGWAHVLLYEEPVALKRVNEMLASTQAILDRVQRGEGALGVMTSEESTKAARKLVAAMDRFGSVADPQTADDGLLQALLFDPKYKSVLEDLQRVTHNFREISDRLVGGRGTLGGLLKDESPEGTLQQASGDFQATMSNLRSITDKLNEGEGTLGALIVDPTIYERLSAILDGASRSFLLRRFIRGLGNDGKRGEGEAGR